MKFVIARRAAKDISDNYDWISDWSTQAANRWRDRLLKAIDSLETTYERFPFAPENDEYEGNLREFMTGKKPHIFRIVFEIRGDTVFILRVRHARQDRLNAEDF